MSIDNYKKIMEDYIKGHRDKFPMDSTFLKELQNFATNHKANAVYHKCILMGKFKLAEAIRQKYMIKEDDRIIAFGASIAAKSFKK